MKYFVNGKELKEFSGRVLDLIIKNSDKGITSAEIADLLDVSPKRVPGAIGALTRAGFVESEKITEGENKGKKKFFSTNVELIVTEDEEPEEEEEEEEEKKEEEEEEEEEE